MVGLFEAVAAEPAATLKRHEFGTVRSWGPGPLPVGVLATLSELGAAGPDGVRTWLSLSSVEPLIRISLVNKLIWVQVTSWARRMHSLSAHCQRHGAA